MAALYPAHALIELRGLPSRAQLFVRRGKSLDARAFLARQEDVYFGVATRKDATSGAAENCDTLPALFVDVDVRERPRAEALAALNAFPLPPSIRVSSGGGVHAYWLLREPLDVSTDESRAAAKALLRRLAVAVEGDVVAAEVARVLRVPGTLNQKYTPPRRVIVEHLDAARRYSPSDFDEWLPAEPSHVKVPRQSAAGPVVEGGRNAHLTRLAGTMRRPGMTQTAIEAALLAENLVSCFPPLPDAEVRAIASSVGRYPATTGAHQQPKAKKPQGRQVEFPDVDPWPDAVDGAALLSAMAQTFSRYVALPAHAANTLALWVLHAYAFDAWFASPIVAITSPAKRCGKTVTLIVLGAFVPRRMFAANVTPAVLFRTIEKYAPTLCIDEADTFIGDNDELRGVLNSGHTRTTAAVIRAVGDDHEPRSFSTWCPKAIALIGKLPSTLDDRAIEIRMRRRLTSERVERLRQDRIDGECAPLCRQAVRWVADHLELLREADPDVPHGLHDRAADCWRPLLALADAAGGAWPRLSREAAVALSGGMAEDDTATQLLADIQEIFTAAGDPDVMGSTQLANELVTREDRPWAEWARGRPLSAAGLTKLLARHDVASAGNLRIGSKIVKGYRRAAFGDAWQRYLPPEKPLHRYTTNESGPESAETETLHTAPSSGFETATPPTNTERCSDVADSQPQEGEDGHVITI